MPEDLAVGLALTLVIEGCLYALFPNAMRQVAAAALGVPAGRLRLAGLAAAFGGTAIVWLVRS